MKTMVKLLAIAAINLPAAAWPAIVQIGNGQYASAYFYSTGSGGCNTNVFVNVIRSELLNPPGLEYLFSSANVYIYQSGTCGTTQPVNGFGSAELTASDFEVAPSLNSAALRTTVPFYDETSGQDFNLDVILTWATWGPPTRFISKDFIGSPGCVSITRSNGTGAYAVASGSVLHEGTNYTPAPDEYALLGSVRDGLFGGGCQ